MTLPGSHPRLTEIEFARFQRLIRAEAGIALAPTKRDLLQGRLLRRLRELGIASFKEYYERVIAPSTGELTHLLDAVATNETHFFREPQHFALLTGSVFPAWIAAAERGARRRRVRVWSAACSTGEEPYSIAMLLLEHLPPEDGWELEVLATDLSTRVLAQARSAVWPLRRSAQIPGPLLKRYMLRGRGPREGTMRACAELRAIVHVEQLNLIANEYPNIGTFDLIFCRNVLIYFEAESKRHVVERLMERLASDGYLFLGHSESLIGVRDDLRRIAPTVYARAGTAPLAPLAHERRRLAPGAVLHRLP